MRTFLFFLILLGATSIRAQITGNILDLDTKEPLMGASVYYEGTSIGVVTNENGYFELEATKGLESPIVVSHVGYTSKQFSQAQLQQQKTIYLKEAAVKLNEVTVRPDDWSRKKKWKYFKREFLGQTKTAKYCKIVNPDDIILVFDKETNRLNAYATKPIRVQNDYLGYEIVYELHEFYILMRLYQLNPVHQVFHAGRSFFKDLNTKNTKKYIKRRRKVYKGSLLHFMRALKANALTKEGFHVYHKQFRRDPANYIKTRSISNLTRVDFKERVLDVLYKKERSAIQFDKNKVRNFFIDTFGNHVPIDAFMVSGVFGNGRIADMLPINFGL